MSGYDDIFGSITQKVRESSSKKKEDIPIFTLLFIGLIFAPLSFLASGWLTMTLWNWFLPLLGLPSVGYAMALGVNHLIGYIRGTSEADKAAVNKAVEDGGSKVIYLWVSMLSFWMRFFTYLGVGYVITLFL
jgi:hypothetical protein